eukprot:TRINITY_DN9035_c0_g1_i1.p1 TRINITY_DN9035_c0_g1~~TRINITY_DN9035_c0_g1_i1.p1  ORF type:complete len:383 (-),score=107.78 TRINITY_DN9035_c0_g1_i1:225-1325(-)
MCIRDSINAEYMGTTQRQEEEINRNKKAQHHLLMSLLVFSSSSRISHTVIRSLYASGKFDRIVCADVFPNYWSLERFFRFRGTLDSVQTSGSRTKVSDLKISERSELLAAVRAASHVVYITHDHYALVPSKINLLKTTAKLVQSTPSVQSFVALTPVELDHFSESDPLGEQNKAEAEARQLLPNATIIRSDLTFGQDSDFANRILDRAANKKTLFWAPNKSGELASPVSTEDLAETVRDAVIGGNLKGKSILAQGNSKVTFDDYLNRLKSASGAEVKTTNFAVIPPTSSNLASDLLYCPSYINFVRFVQAYRGLGNLASYESLKSVKGNLRDLDSGFGQIDLGSRVCKDGAVEWLLKSRLYQQTSR